MKIVGFQKLSLVDYPNKMACIIFTEGCNYRCPFCYNSSLVYDKSNQTYTEEDIFRYLRKRKGIIDAICISGGEPTLQKDLIDFLKRLREEHVLIKLDTNGSNPDILKEIIDAKLVDYIAMDIKNVIEKYAITTGIDNINTNNILKSINLLKEGQVDYEFRTTIVKEFHTMDDIKAMSKLVKGSKYYLQNFEDNENVCYEGLHSFTEEELIEIEKDNKNLTIRGFIHNKKEEE